MIDEDERVDVIGWKAIGELLGLKEDQAKRRYVQSLGTDDPMPIIPYGRPKSWKIKLGEWFKRQRKPRALKR